MKVTQRIDLIRKIARELQARYTFIEIDALFSAYNIKHPQAISYNSKWTYSKEVLQDVNNALLLDLAAELGIRPNLQSNSLPKIWEENKCFRLFISHLAAHKEKAMKMKEALKPYHISSFVAHDDIIPTLQWQIEIERALGSMDALLCIHTKGFSQSYWTQQEIGFALGRGIKIMSLRMDEDPQGFISKHQAILRKNRNAEGVAKEISEILAQDPMTKDRMKEVLNSYKEEK